MSIEESPQGADQAGTDHDGSLSLPWQKEHRAGRNYKAGNRLFPEGPEKLADRKGYLAETARNKNRTYIQLESEKANEGQRKMPTEKPNSPNRKQAQSKFFVVWRRLINRYRPEQRYMRG